MSGFSFIAVARLVFQVLMFLCRVQKCLFINLNLPIIIKLVINSSNLIHEVALKSICFSFVCITKLKLI